MHTHAHRHEHTPTLTVKKSLADIKRLGDKGVTFPGDTLLAAVLMQASATVWSGASFPPHCPGFSAAPSHIHNVGKKEVVDLCQVPLSQNNCGAKPGSE